MTLPNFLVIGAQKAGTSAIYYYLNKHPQIYMSSLKEPGFFHFENEEIDFCGPGDRRYYSCRVTSIEAYKKLFQEVSSEVAVGEASTWYLHSIKAPERIKHYIHDAKLIAILRNPVDRAYSAFMHARREEREPFSNFMEALQEEDARIQNNWGHLWRYKHMSLYATQLKHYYKLFNRNQIKVYLHEDLNNNPANLLKDVFRFLGVEETFTPDLSIRRNVSGIPKNKVLHRFLSEKQSVKNVLKPFFPTPFRERIVSQLVKQNLVKEPLSAEVRQELTKVFQQDIFELQDLLQRDLSKWLEPSR